MNLIQSSLNPSISSSTNPSTPLSMASNPNLNLIYALLSLFTYSSSTYHPISHSTPQTSLTSPIIFLPPPPSTSSSNLPPSTSLSIHHSSFSSPPLSSISPPPLSISTSIPTSIPTSITSSSPSSLFSSTTSLLFNPFHLLPPILSYPSSYERSTLEPLLLSQNQQMNLLSLLSSIHASTSLFLSQKSSFSLTSHSISHRHLMNYYSTTFYYSSSLLYSIYVH